MYFTNRPSQILMFLQGFTQTKSIYFSKVLFFYSNTDFNAMPQRVPGNGPCCKNWDFSQLEEVGEVGKGVVLENPA